MTGDEYHTRLTDIHRTFLNDDYFTVASILTPPECWLTIGFHENGERKTAEKAMRNGLTNVVVTEDNRPIGFINSQDLKYKKWSALVKIEDCQVSASTHLTQIVEEMVNAAESVTLERSPLYFAYDSDNKGKRQPIGIFTFWDLNRGPAYTISYLGLHYLEHTLLQKIRDYHKVWSDHEDILKRLKKTKLDDNSKKRVKTTFGGQSFNLRSLSKWGLAELITFYEIDDHVVKDLGVLPEEFVAAFKNPDFGNYRNRVGHPVKLLVSDSGMFKDDLRKLKVTWDIGSRIFLSFRDPKVRHESADPCDLA